MPHGQIWLGRLLVGDALIHRSTPKTTDHRMAARRFSRFHFYRFHSRPLHRLLSAVTTSDEHSAASATAALLNPSTPLTNKQKSRAALSLLKSEKDPSRILAICRAASLNPTSRHDRTALSIAISNLSSSHSAILSLLDPLLSSPSDHLRSHAILLLGQAGMLDDAIRTFQACPSLRSLNSLLSACILANKHHHTTQIFSESPAAYKISPNVETYNIVIKALCESGSSKSVHQVFDLMSMRRMNPNMATFRNALSGFYKEEKFDDVAKVLNLMQKKGCDPWSVDTYNERIKGLCLLKRSGDAKGLLKEMLEKEVKPDWVTYSNLIIGFCKEGFLDESRKLYREMKSSGCVPNAAFYFTLIYHLCEDGDFDMALEVCREIMSRNKVPCFSTMKMLVNGLARGSKVEVAREIIGEMKEKFPDNSEVWEEVEDKLPLYNILR